MIVFFILILIYVLEHFLVLGSFLIFLPIILNIKYNFRIVLNLAYAMIFIIFIVVGVYGVLLFDWWYLYYLWYGMLKFW